MLRSALHRALGLLPIHHITYTQPDSPGPSGSMIFTTPTSRWPQYRVRCGLTTSCCLLCIARYKLHLF